MTAARVRMLRRAIKAHPTRSHRVKWLAAVGYLRSRHLWLLEQQPKTKVAV